MKNLTKGGKSSQTLAFWRRKEEFISQLSAMQEMKEERANRN